RLYVLLYTILLMLVTILPWLTGMSGYPYLFAALALGGVFLWHAVKMYTGRDDDQAMQTFVYSINYLMALFAALLIDHYIA
ncbi:MAG: protoheme IX farnesyltransferase, partial [Cyanobacteria bacterium P01_E01_bin.48]